MGKINPYLLAFILIFFLLAVAAIATLVVLYLQAKSEKKSTTLPTSYPPHPTVSTNNKTLGRIKAAVFIREGLNPSADPCNDFYLFACGNWTQKNPMPQGRRLFDTLTKLQENVNEKLYNALRNVDANDPNTLNALVKVRRIFDSCTNMVDMDRHIKSMDNPLVQLLLNSEIGMWPLLQIGWKPEQEKLSVESLAGMLSSNFGVNTFLTPIVSVDWMDVTKHRLFLDEADLTLGSRTFYLNDTQEPVLRAYAEIIEAAARQIATDVNGFIPVRLSAEVSDIVSFEINLAEIMTANPANVNFEKSYNPYTSAKLTRDFPSFDWFKYFSRLLPIDLHWSEQGPASKVILLSPDYTEKLIALLKRTSKKTVYNYLIWKLIYSRLWALSSQYRDLHRSLVETLDISRQAPPQSMQCISLVTEFAGFAIGRLFIDANFHQSERPYVAAVINEILLAQTSVLQNVSWMNNITREKAVRKANAVLSNPAYPLWILNDTVLNGYYRNLSISPDRYQTFFAVYNNLTAWQGSRSAYQLLKPAKRTEYFGASPALSNAWYSPEYNTVTVPAGIVQSPVFQANYPASLRFGGMGTIIGHELTHGFDNQGVQFGPNGSLSDWFDDYSRQKFQQKEQCFINEYSQYCYRTLGMCVNGRQTLGENMADQGGLKVAYTAFRNYVSKNGPDPKLPGLESFSNDQLFFMSYARLWCGEVNKEVIEQQILLNPHPPDKVRVLGTLKNSKEFASAFKCSDSSNMVSKFPC